MRHLSGDKFVGVPWLCLGVLVLAAFVGCAKLPYRYGDNLITQNDADLKPGEPQIERGRRMPVLDTVGWIVGIPAKIVMFDRHVDNHDVSPETEAKMQEYLANNDLDKVKVRVNEYDPLGEWGRLGRNKSVGWPARYTLGTLSVASYTLFPGRIFGWDKYNPYTNTIYLYSDVPAMALYEGGYAKDFAQREYKGWYGLGYEIPLVNLWHHSRASGDAMAYLKDTAPTQEIKDGYRTIGPAYAVNASRGLGSVAGVPLVLPAALAGHAVGQVKAASFEEKAPGEPPKMETPDVAAE